MGKHLSHGGLDHPLAIVGLRAVGIFGDIVVVDTASVLSPPILGVLVLEKLGLVHLPESDTMGLVSILIRRGKCIPGIL